MIVRQHILHTSRELEIKDTEQTMARNFERVLGLQEGACIVELVEHPEKKPCKTNEVPHCHYAAIIQYDETKTISIDKK